MKAPALYVVIVAIWGLADVFNYVQQKIRTITIHSSKLQLFYSSYTVVKEGRTRVSGCFVKVEVLNNSRRVKYSAHSLYCLYVAEDP